MAGVVGMARLSVGWHCLRAIGYVLAALAIGVQAHAQDRPKIEVVPQIPHANDVKSVAFTPDGARVLSGGDDQTLKLWDAATGWLIRTFEGHTKGVSSVAFSPDGARVLSGSGDNTLKLWDAGTDELICTFVGHEFGVTSVKFSPDGDRVLSGSGDNTLKLWDAGTGELIRTFEGHEAEVSSVAFSPDGTRVLSGSEDDTLMLWDAGTGLLIHTFEGHTNGVRSVAFSPDGAHVLSGSRDGTLKLWEAGTGRLIRTFEGHKLIVDSVAFSPDGTRVLSGSSDITVKLWDAATGQLIRTFAGHSNWVSSVAFSPDGARVLSGSWDESVKLWDAATGQLIRTFGGHTDWVSSVAFSPDGARVLSGGRDKTLKLWDAATGRLIRTFEGHTEGVSSVAFSPDGARVLSGGLDQTLKLWDAATGRLIRTFEGHTEGVSSVAFSPDGARVLSGGLDQTLKLWDAATGRLIRTLEGHRSWVFSVAFSPDGACVLSGSWLNPLKLWDTSTGRLIRTLEGHRSWVFSVAFSPDGARVLSGSLDRTLKLWDAATGQLIRTFEGHTDSVFAVAFSPDGARVLSGSEDGTLKLWDAATGQLIRTFAGHTNGVRSVAFSTDGARVLSGGVDTTTRIWDAATGQDLVRMMASANGEWLAMTPTGFFDASDRGLGMVAVVRGLEVFSVDQFRDQLQRKDLVVELLSGDVLRNYEDESSRLNLQDILNSGAAPQLELLEEETEYAGDTVRLKVRIFNNESGGIGERLIWRVNGQAQGETQPAVLKGRNRSGDPVVVSQALRLDPSQENIVTVTAYNGAGLLATLPLPVRIDEFGATLADQPRPRMFILAIGVNEYTEPALVPLQFAINDVKTLARNLKMVAQAGGYDSVKIIERIKGDATREKIKEAFDSISQQSRPQDTLIVLLAGHGKSSKGRYYYLPITTRFGDGRNLTTEGVPVETWQQWIASVQVDKKLLIIDTCESSDAIVMVRGSRAVLARETAVERLRQAVGHSVITAAREVAYEGSSLGHGVLSYAVLEALSQPAPSGGLIDVKAIDSHVVEAVPLLSERLSGQRQDPYNKIVGNFPIGAPMKGGPIERVLTKVQPGRYILFGRVRIAVRARPAADAEVIMELDTPTEVQVIEFLSRGWTLIGRDDAKLGYVPSDVVLKLKE